MANLMGEKGEVGKNIIPHNHFKKLQGLYYI
jgi:hypothetical protein